jgi:hypothetical protein
MGTKRAVLPVVVMTGGQTQIDKAQDDTIKFTE